jgi:hypothetical protein
VVSAAQDFDGVGEEVCDCVEGFDGALGAAGKIQNDGLVTNDGDAAGEDGRGSLLDSFAADFLGEAGDSAIRNVKSGFGCGVAGAEAGATCGKEQVGVASIADGAKLAANRGLVVGATECRSYLPAELAATLNESGTREVLALTAGDGIADGEDSDAHEISSKLQVFTYRFKVK